MDLPSFLKQLKNDKIYKNNCFQTMDIRQYEKLILERKEIKTLRLMFAPRLLLVESFQQVEEVEEPKHGPIIPLS